jgi:transcription-repair coupling factor (superfamily II helicase)
VLAKPYGVLKIDANPKLMSITFRAKSAIDPRRVIELVQRNRAVKLAGNDKLRIEREIANPADRAHYLRDLLRSLGQPLEVGA